MLSTGRSLRLTASEKDSGPAHSDGDNPSGFDEDPGPAGNSTKTLQLPPSTVKGDDLNPLFIVIAYQDIYPISLLADLPSSGGSGNTGATGQSSTGATGVSFSANTGAYLPGPFGRANYRLGIASMTVNWTLNAFNSVGNIFAKPIAAGFSQIDRFQGELISIESGVPGPAGGMLIAGTTFLSKISKGITSLEAANAAKAATSVSRSAAFRTARNSVAFHGLRSR